MSSPAFVATLVVNPARPTLSDAFVARAAQILPGFVDRRWLDPGIAADLYFDGDSGARALLAPLAAEARADVIIQPVATRGKRLLVADMDSTLIGQECIDELAAAAGVGSHVVGITERAMRGEIPFEAALRERVALLADLPSRIIEELLATRITLNSGARVLVATMRSRGAYMAIVSGGFTPFTGEIARRLGADEHRANHLEIVDGRLTGKVREPILGAEAKLFALRELTATLGLVRDETVAVGDGANDLAMLAEAGLGVAFRAKPKVAAAAHARVDNSDLTALLYAQGIERREFVEIDA
jgi:phosphoserine phosphatase